MSQEMRNLINKVKNFNSIIEENVTHTIKLYHGTIPKFVEKIKSNGLEDTTSTAYTQGWYMLATDFESALFHANSDENKDFVYVFEFEVPILNNDRWIGYPYLWKGYVRNEKSTWFALMQKIPKQFIKKVHKISFDTWLNQKNKGF